VKAVQSAKVMPSPVSEPSISAAWVRAKVDLCLTFWLRLDEAASVEAHAGEQWVLRRNAVAWVARFANTRLA